MSHAQLALCLRGFAALRLRAYGEENRSLHFNLVHIFTNVLRESKSTSEIADAIFG